MPSSGKSRIDDLIICFPSVCGEPEVAVFKAGPGKVPLQILRMMRSVFRGTVDDVESSHWVKEYDDRGYLLIADRPLTDWYDTELYLKVLRALTEKYGFRWLFLGWDQETRFIRRGVMRSSHPKVIIDYTGKYVIKPRCRLCHDKVEYCQCFDTLQEAAECLEGERHYCESCSLIFTLEKWFNGKDQDNLRSFWKYIHLGGPLDVPGFDENGPIDLEIVARYFEEHYGSWWSEESSNWDYDDEGTCCVCPLEG